MTRRCLVLILCGIPAVGKSTFSSNLVAKLKTTERRTVITSVCFDDIIPSHGLDVGSVVADDANGETKQYGIWKKYRLQIIETIENIISNIIKESLLQFIEQSEEAFAAESISNVKEAVKRQFKSSMKLLECDTNETEKVAKKADLIAAEFIFILDDNFYYQSMRYQYFQVCRKYNISFCQIYIDCPLDLAIERNRLRDNPVSDETISVMATRFEKPDGDSKDSWEDMSLQIDGSKELTEATWAAVLALIHKSLAHPVQPILVEDLQEKDESRLRCLKNMIHQGDQILRRLISERMKLNKEKGLPKSEMKRVSGKLNQARQEILASLREGELHPQLSDVADTSNELHTFLQKLLDNHLKS